MTRIGRTRALRMPKIAAPTNAAPTMSTRMPGTRYAARTIATVEINQLMKSPHMGITPEYEKFH
ncbi:MAG: hypothetical protein WCO26_22750 [Deltaproteobacteria bacterium]